MINEFMDRDSIIAHLRSSGLEPVAKKDVKELFISKKIIRCKDGDTLIVGMGNNQKKDDQINLLVDAIHICSQTNFKSLRLILGKRKIEKEQDEVENAIALMMKSLKVALKIQIMRDAELLDGGFPPPRSFNEAPKGKIEGWMNNLSCERKLPGFAKELEKTINHDYFKWYKPVTGQQWSGRVGGLEVCTLNPSRQEGRLMVGNPGNNGDGQARKIFLNIIEKENFADEFFNGRQINKVAAVINALAESRRNPKRRKGELSEFQREHLLESLVLSRKVKIVSREGALDPVFVDDYPFQFPTLWEPSAQPRFVDALMRLGDIPYIVELKEGHSPGEYYRHAITQAVLYREFIRRAEKVHSWFGNRNLNPQKCRAVVAFPKLNVNNKIHQMILKQHIKTADSFGIEIAEIEGFE